MQVYVTERGIRCNKRRYSRVAGLSLKEAHYLKRKGTLKLKRETAEILIERGWAVEDCQHPLVAKSFPVPVNDEPVQLTTQEIVPEETTEAEAETEALGSDEAEDAAEMSDDSASDGAGEDDKNEAKAQGADFTEHLKRGIDKEEGGQ